MLDIGNPSNTSPDAATRVHGESKGKALFFVIRLTHCLPREQEIPEGPETTLSHLATFSLKLPPVMCQPY